MKAPDKTLYGVRNPKWIVDIVQMLWGWGGVGLGWDVNVHGRLRHEVDATLGMGWGWGGTLRFMGTCVRSRCYVGHGVGLGWDVNVHGLRFT